MLLEGQKGVDFEAEPETLIFKKKKEQIFTWNCKNGNGCKKVVCVCARKIEELKPDGLYYSRSLFSWLKNQGREWELEDTQCFYVSCGHWRNETEMKISPSILINEKYHSHPWFLVSKYESGFLKLWSSRCCHPPWWLLRSWGAARSNCLPLLKMNKETGLAPESWVDMKGMNSESRGLHLPICRMLNSLTWYLIFDVQAACFLCCKLVYSLTSPSASLEQFSQSYWDAVSQAPSPKCSHQIK